MPEPHPNPYLTEEAFLANIGHGLARKRIRLALTQEELSGQAGVGKRTVERLEAGESIQLASFLRILRVLGLLGQLEALVPEPSATPMELLKQKSKEKQRASPRKKTATGGKAWTWGDVP